MFISFIFTYAAVESIVNNLIPNNYSEINNSYNEGNEIGKKWIEKNIILTEKIKVFIPNIYSISIDTNSLKFWNNFKRLEYFRNELIHFKSEEFIDDTLKTGPFISEVFVELSKQKIIESGREVIKMLVKKIPNIQGLPHEFHRDHYDLEQNMKYFSRKR